MGGDMSSDSKSYRVQIIVAVIGLVGVLGGALIANWDKVFDSKTNDRPNSSISSTRQPSGLRQPTVPTTKWQQQGSYQGDCRARPVGMVCAGYEDGYVWLIRGAISGWEKRVEGGQTIQVAIATTGRYEHILGTSHVRKVQ
jgi:hypothetical protein